RGLGGGPDRDLAIHLGRLAGRGRELANVHRREPACPQRLDIGQGGLRRGQRLLSARSQAPQQRECEGAAHCGGGGDAGAGASGAGVAGAAAGGGSGLPAGAAGCGAAAGSAGAPWNAGSAARAFSGLATISRAMVKTASLAAPTFTASLGVLLIMPI